jgi:hypothetical protein
VLAIRDIVTLGKSLAPVSDDGATLELARGKVQMICFHICEDLAELAASLAEALERDRSETRHSSQRERLADCGGALAAWAGVATHIL